MRCKFFDYETRCYTSVYYGNDRTEESKFVGKLNRKINRKSNEKFELVNESH